LLGVVENWIKELTGLIESGQREDGYLNTYFAHEKFDQRCSNLGVMHELYCAGHFIQASIAHFCALGCERLLNCALWLADHIPRRFGWQESGKQPCTNSHEVIEMALVELWRTTGNCLQY
jgi:DUF1680 family protein